MTRPVNHLPGTRQHVTVQSARTVLILAVLGGSLALLGTPGMLTVLLGVLLPLVGVPASVVATERLLRPRSCTKELGAELAKLHRRARRLQHHQGLAAPAADARLTLERVEDMLQIAHEADREASEVITRLAQRSQHRLDEVALLDLLGALREDGSLSSLRASGVPTTEDDYDRLEELERAGLEMAEVAAYRNAWRAAYNQRSRALTTARARIEATEEQLVRLEAHRRFAETSGLGIDVEAVARRVASRQSQLERVSEQASEHLEGQRLYLESLEALRGTPRSLPS